MIKRKNTQNNQTPKLNICLYISLFLMFLVSYIFITSSFLNIEKYQNIVCAEEFYFEPADLQKPSINKKTPLFVKPDGNKNIVKKKEAQKPNNNRKYYKKLPKGLSEYTEESCW